MSTRNQSRRIRRAVVAVAVAAGVVVSVPATADASHRDRVCDERGRCATVTAPKSGKVKRESRRMDRQTRPTYLYVGRVSKPLKSGGLTIVRKSRVRGKTWHVWQARRVTVSPVTPPPAETPGQVCERRRAALPVGYDVGRSHLYPGTVACDPAGRMVVTATELVEDAYGWNLYADGGTDAATASEFPRLDPGCLTDTRDGYTMCADGRVYLRTVERGTVTRSHTVYRIPA